MGLLQEIERGHYASLQLNYGLRSDLEGLKRNFEDAAATADTEVFVDAEAIRASMHERIASYRSSSPIDTAEYDEFESALDLYVDFALATTESFLAGAATDQVFEDLQRMNADYSGLEQMLVAMIERDGNAVNDGLANIVGAQVRATNTALGLVIVFIVGLAAVSWVIIFSTTRAIQSAVLSMSSLAKGDLTRRDVEVTRDEIGTMIGSVGTVTETIDSLTHEVGHLVQAVRAGRLKTKGNSTRFEGAYAELIDNINELIDAFVLPIELTGEYVEKISRGELPPKISESYEGDFNRIKESINLLVTTMTGLVEQAGILTSAAKAGRLDTRGAAERFSGTWRTLVSGINETLDAVAEPVQEVSAVMSAMAQGNLARRVSDGYEGLFDRMSNDVNETGRTLAEVAGAIRNSALTIQLGIQEVADGNNDLSSRTESQSASLEETAASIEAMTLAVTANAGRTRDASDAAASARDMAQTGETVVNKAVDAMTELNESSRSVVEIINVIDTIAFQTNLLALNAAVEAARAGEQGRGFAVVASEVRQLAGRSAEAAKEIKELIQNSTTKIDEGARLVGDCGETLKQIIQSVKRVADLVKEISDAGQEQERGIQEINSVVRNLDDMTQQNASMVVEVAAASNSIGVQVADLTSKLDFFKEDDIGDVGTSERQRMAS